MRETVRRHSILTSLKWRGLSLESQIRFTVKEWREEICEKRSSEDSVRKTVRKMQQTFTPETDSFFLSISGVWKIMIFMEANWDWWIQKKFSSQLTRNYRVQELLNVISSSSRMLSSTLLTVSWKAWLINEITSNLQRHNFDRRTNQGTRQHFCEKIQHWYLKIFTRTINTPPITRWRNKRIIRDYNIHILFRTHEWDIVNYYSPMKNSSFLEIKVVPKMCKNCFWNPSWFPGWLEVKVKNVINCLKDEGCFQNASECPFSSYPPPLPAPHFSRDFM